MVGLDISPSALDRNRLLDDRIVGDLETYPLPRKAFDVVVCWDVLEHLLAVKSLIAKFTPH